jgi:hypothetical protein
MKALKLKYVVAALILAGAAPAYANLLQVPGLEVTGTGLGAVSTLVTIQDNAISSKSSKNNSINSNGNGIESGCVTYTGNIGAPGFLCQNGVEGGDNQAINRLYLASSIAGLTSAGQLGVVVNISEKTPSATASLTHLYLTLYNLQTGLRLDILYGGLPLDLGDKGGIGQSGANLFQLDAGSITDANGFCPVLSKCVIGGGMQFAAGTTSATPETMYIGALTGVPGEPPPLPMPEPAALALFGLGMAGLGLARRRR